MREILLYLAKRHPDAYELFGGDDMHWHLEETPFDGTEKETEHFTKGLHILREFAEIAADMHAGDRQARLESKVAEFQKAVYGLNVK